MKQSIFIRMIVCLLSAACGEKKDQATPDPVQPIDAAHNSRNSLDWDGVYEGMIPGANSDIHTVITLSSDNSYSMTYQYVDKSDEKFTDTGTFQWNDEGNTITLSDSSPSMYFVGENTLTQLDMEGNRIPGEMADKYVLRKLQ